MPSTNNNNEGTLFKRQRKNDDNKKNSPPFVPLLLPDGIVAHICEFCDLEDLTLCLLRLNSQWRKAAGSAIISNLPWEVQVGANEVLDSKDDEGDQNAFAECFLSLRIENQHDARFASKECLVEVAMEKLVDEVGPPKNYYFGFMQENGISVGVPEYDIQTELEESGFMQIPRIFESHVDMREMVLYDSLLLGRVPMNAAFPINRTGGTLAIIRRLRGMLGGVARGNTTPDRRQYRNKKNDNCPIATTDPLKRLIQASDSRRVCLKLVVAMEVAFFYMMRMMRSNRDIAKSCLCHSVHRFQRRAFGHEHIDQRIQLSLPPQCHQDGNDGVKLPARATGSFESTTAGYKSGKDANQQHQQYRSIEIRLLEHSRKQPKQSTRALA